MARSLLLPVAALLLLAVAVRAYDVVAEPTLLEIEDEPKPEYVEPKPEYVDLKPEGEYPEGEEVMYQTTDIKVPVKTYKGYQGWDSYKANYKTYSPSYSSYSSYGYQDITDVCDIPENLEDALQLPAVGFTGEWNPCTVVLQCECKCTTDNAIIDKKTGAPMGAVDGYAGEVEPCMCPRAISLCNCPDEFTLVLGKKGQLQCIDGILPNPCNPTESPCVKPKPIKPSKRPGTIKFKLPKTWDKEDPAYFDSYPVGKGAEYWSMDGSYYIKDGKYYNTKDDTEYTGPKYGYDPKYVVKAPKGGYKAPKYGSKYSTKGEEVIFDDGEGDGFRRAPVPKRAAPKAKRAPAPKRAPAKAKRAARPAAKRARQG